MHEVVRPMSNEDEGTVKGHSVFQVNIVQFQDQVPHWEVTSLFGAEDIVTTMLENMQPWYEPRNLGVFVAFSATCWGALKVVRQVIGSAPTLIARHLPSPWFVNGRPSLLEVHHQWQTSMETNQERIRRTRTEHRARTIASRGYGQIAFWSVDAPGHNQRLYDPLISED